MSSFILGNASILDLILAPNDFASLGFKYL